MHYQLMITLHLDKFDHNLGVLEKMEISFHSHPTDTVKMILAKHTNTRRGNLSEFD